MAVAKPITTSGPQEGINRRNILMALPFAGAALAMPVLVKAHEGESPIMCLFRQHRTIKVAAGNHVCTATGPHEDREMHDLFGAHTLRIEAEMMALPTTCAADMAAKMLVAHCDGEFSLLELDNPVWVEARALMEVRS